MFYYKFFLLLKLSKKKEKGKQETYEFIILEKWDLYKKNIASTACTNEETDGWVSV